MSSGETSLTDKELVIFDLDGTLAPSKQPMDARTAELLSELLTKIKVAIISGGGWPQFETQFLRSMPQSVDGYGNLLLLPTSGTQLRIWKGSWTELYAEYLSPKEKQDIMAALHVALTESGYTQPTKTYGEVIEDRLSQVTFSACGQMAPLDVKSVWDPTLEKRMKIAEILKKRIPTFDVRIGGTTSIDITRKGVNKAYGIHKLEAHLKIPISKMLYVGDALFFGGNDYPAKTTGVDCIQVKGPEDTKKLVAEWLA